jgi:tetratricopeptide (TPR) repeat protein
LVVRAQRILVARSLPITTQSARKCANLPRQTTSSTTALYCIAALRSFTYKHGSAAMAKTRPSKPSSASKRKDKKRQKSLLNTTGGLSSNPLAQPVEDVPALVAAAGTLLHAQHEPTEALALATRALQQDPNSLPTLELLAEIQVELGDVDTAYTLYSRAAALDPNGAHESAGGSGPEKFLWLAQLSPAGGEEAVRWYETGVEVLRRFAVARDTGTHPDLAERQLEKKLVSALCGLAEIYMSDLCMASDAEARCESYVTEALLAAPESSEALQTLASVRISQQREEDAVAALQRAVAGLGNEDAELPSYAVRIGLARLLIETAQYESAIDVLERLQAEDDQLPDLWYLGGWTLFLLGERENGKRDGWKELWEAAREWLGTCQQVGCPFLRERCVVLIENSCTKHSTGKTKVSATTRLSC